MSFDLYFYKKKENPLTEQDLATYLTNNLPFNGSKSTRQWDYENPETGVYFTIDWNMPDDDDDEFDGFVNLNFTFSLNFFRPIFFGLESFPIIDKIVEDLDLFIFDPQNPGGDGVPQKFAEGFLMDEWIRHNNGVSIDRFKEFQLKYLPPEKSNYLWQFQYQRERLQNKLDEDVFVAGILVLESTNDGQLYTVCIWPQHIPVILPKVDYVIVKKVYKRFFKEVEESGLVSYNQIMKKLGNAFEDFASDIPDLKLVTQEKANKIKNKFNDLKIESATLDFGKMVAMDKFVNVRPQ